MPQLGPKAWNGLNISDMTGVGRSGSGQFVLVDNSGDIASSADGLNWTPQASTSAGLDGIAYGNGFFAAVGDSGAIYLSSGSNYWFANQSGQANNLYGISFGNGQFVVAGQSGTVLEFVADGEPARIRRSRIGHWPATRPGRRTRRILSRA